MSYFRGIMWNTQATTENAPPSFALVKGILDRDNTGLAACLGDVPLARACASLIAEGDLLDALEEQ